MSENTNYCDYPVGDCVLGKELMGTGYKKAIEEIRNHKCRVLMMPFEKCDCVSNMTQVADWLEAQYKKRNY
jgi:hypothetical protein